MEHPQKPSDLASPILKRIVGMLYKFPVAKELIELGIAAFHEPCLALDFRYFIPQIALVFPGGLLFHLQKRDLLKPLLQLLDPADRFADYEPALADIDRDVPNACYSMSVELSSEPSEGISAGESVGCVVIA